MADKTYLDQLSKRLANDGKLIEAGWVGLRLHVIPLDAPVDQLREMRIAFMAGAQHLFASLLSIFDKGIEPTEGDMKRMTLIAEELDVFRKEMEVRAATPRGNG